MHHYFILIRMTLYIKRYSVIEFVTFCLSPYTQDVCPTHGHGGHGGHGGLGWHGGHGCPQMFEQIFF